MDVVIASALHNSCLSSSTKSSDFVLRQVDNKKFMSDSKSSFSIQKSSTQRFIPLALNHLGLRGAHFTATLKEFATQLVTRSEGCPLLKGPFALSPMGAFKKIMHTWGACLTWTARREHAAQIVRSVDSFHACSAFFAAARRVRGGGRWEGG